ncbi:MAG: hypothetical protein RSB59_03575 [Clostridia bacterium]
MKKRDLEKKLAQAGENFVPDVLNEVVKNSPQQPNGEVIALSACNKQNKKMRIAIVTACILIFLISLSTGGYFFINADDSFIYVDINPSVMLTLNKVGNVKSVTAKNLDAEALISGKSFSGLTVDQTIDEILQLALDKNYIDNLSEDNEIMLSVYNNNEKKAKKQLNKINNSANKFLGGKGINCKIDNEIGNKKECEKASHQGISPAKLKIINAIIAIDDAYKVDTLKTYSVKELRNLLKSLTK